MFRRYASRLLDFVSRAEATAFNGGCFSVVQGSVENGGSQGAAISDHGCSDIAM